MKLAFVTLMSCLIAVSWQQHNQRHQSGANPYWSRPQYQQLQSPYYQPNYPPFYHDYYRGPYSPYSAPSYPNYYQQQQQPQQPFYKQQRPLVDELKLAALLSQLSQEQQQLKPQPFPERLPVSDQPIDDETLLKQLLASTNNDDTVVQGSFEDFAELVSRYPGIVEQNKKQLLAALNTEGRGFLWPALFVGAQILSTSTKYTYTTSTITSTSVISCIPSASFYGGSTQSCRRKRSIVDIEAHEDQMPFNPSAVHSVESSAVYDELSLSRQPRSAELLSSFDQPEEPIMEGVEMSKYESFVRAQRAGIFGSTVTSTLTTYSISTTSSKKTVTIGSSLSCLPSGYSVC